MRIGDLARRTGLTRDAIRLYERTGLLGDVGREPGNGYKDYPESAVGRLARVREAQALGFTLREIAAFVEPWDNDRLSTAEQRSRVERKLAEVDRRLSRLHALRDLLGAALGRLDACPEEPAPDGGPP